MRRLWRAFGVQVFEVYVSHAAPPLTAPDPASAPPGFLVGVPFSTPKRTTHASVLARARL